MNQEVISNQMQPPWCLHPGLHNLQNCETQISAVYKIINLWYFVVKEVAQLYPTFCDPVEFIQSVEFSRPVYWSG